MTLRTRLSLLVGFVRFRHGLRRFLADTITPEQARRIIAARLRRREETFLELLEHAVFAYPRNPYRRLFDAAGCELGDVRSLVSRDGLEGALARLHHAGVFVDFEEFKGRQPAIRGSQTFHFREGDFDNPLLHPHYAIRSSGSWGPPRRTLIDLDYLADRAPLWCLWFAHHHLLDAPLIFVAPHHPGSVNLHLICAKFGARFVRWFATAGAGSPTYRVAAAYLNGCVSRIGGLPAPEFVNARDLGSAARHLAELASAGTTPCVNTAPSVAIRLGQALGGDRPLRGVTFLLGFEPLTAARRDAIEASGARAVATYGFSEGGTLGQQCSQPVQPDDVHVAADAFVVIQAPRPRTGPAAGLPLFLTSLRPTTPKLMLNTSIGDAGLLETRRCGCLFEELGYHQHLHTIRSTHKMTGEGVTFLGPDLVRVLEDVLPGRFGGAPTHYQLLEEEGPDGLTRCRLLVSPDVGAVDEQAVAEAFLDSLSRCRPAYRFMVEQWVQGRHLTVARERPIATSREKMLPFHTLRTR